MRTNRWLATVLVISGAVLVNTPAFGAQTGGAWSGGWAAFGAPACGAPGYGTMAPGCCELRPTCCDHVWDGYCQNKGCHKRHCVSPAACSVPACAGCQSGMMSSSMPAVPASIPAGSALEMFQQVPPSASGINPPSSQPTVAPAKPVEAAPTVTK